MQVSECSVWLGSRDGFGRTGAQSGEKLTAAEAVELARGLADGSHEHLFSHPTENSIEAVRVTATRTRLITRERSGRVDFGFMEAEPSARPAPTMDLILPSGTTNHRLRIYMKDGETRSIYCADAETANLLADRFQAGALTLTAPSTQRIPRKWLGVKIGSRTGAPTTVPMDDIEAVAVETIGTERLALYERDLTGKKEPVAGPYRLVDAAPEVRTSAELSPNPPVVLSQSWDERRELCNQVFGRKDVWEIDGIISVNCAETIFRHGKFPVVVTVDDPSRVDEISQKVANLLGLRTAAYDPKTRSFAAADPKIVMSGQEVA